MDTAREVTDNLIRRKPAPRVGNMDHPWGQTMKKWATQGLPTDDEGRPVSAGEHFDFDMGNVGGGITWTAQLGVSEILEETEEWRIVRDGNGAAMKRWKERPGTPEHMDFLMTDRGVWERDYRPHLLELNPERLHAENVKKNIARLRNEGRWSHFGHMFIWEWMRASMGDYTMFMSLAADPEWVADYCQVYTEFHIKHMTAIIEQAGKPDGVWVFEDLGYKHRLFCSPETLAEYIFPHYAKLVEFYHSYDLPVVLHTCGFVEPALDLIVEAGFDALNPMEVKAGNDPLRIADSYADKLAFIGGLDARVLESGDRDLIRAEVTKLVEGMKQRGASYVYGSDHSLSTLIDYDDFQYALAVYREHMTY